MRVKLYQINMDRDENNVCFMRHESLERFQGNSLIDSKIYDLVYDNDVIYQNLEDIFQLFNIEHPSDYKGRSLSVSDIVEICDEDILGKGFYFCDSFGFKRVDFYPEECKISERFNKKTEKIHFDEKLQNTKNRTSDITHNTGNSKERKYLPKR